MLEWTIISKLQGSISPNLAGRQPRYPFMVTQNYFVIPATVFEKFRFPQESNQRDPFLNQWEKTAKPEKPENLLIRDVFSFLEFGKTTAIKKRPRKRQRNRRLSLILVLKQLKVGHLQSTIWMSGIWIKITFLESTGIIDYGYAFGFLGRRGSLPQKWLSPYVTYLNFYTDHQFSTLYYKRLGGRAV